MVVRSRADGSGIMDFGPRPNNAALDLHTWHAFKIYGGQIHAVEAFMKVLPTGTPSGWD